MNLPLGYRYAASYAGIRKTKQNDIALIVSEQPAEAAAVFTLNRVQAAPVRLSKSHLKKSGHLVSALLINAGNANCATRTGDRVALQSSKAVSKALRVDLAQVLPSSTGVIGVELPLEKLTAAIPELVKSLAPDQFEAVAQAIMTTDTRMKTAAEELQFEEGTVRIAGMAKGSGMIHPNMATTLAYVVTDAKISSKRLQGMVAAGTRISFNALTVDGDMSTNDTLIVLANGAAKVKPSRTERDVFAEALTRVLVSLARQIAADGEGARKLIIVETAGFDSEREARQVARAISNSPLVKTAIAGSDPNWGRIISAAGYADVDFDPSDIDVYLQDVLVCNKGLAAEPFDEDAMKQKLDADEVHIRVVQRGKKTGSARFFTCDLTEGYIRINGSYRT